MNAKPRHDSRWLLTTAKAVANKLKSCCEGTSLRIRIPSRVDETNTAGWMVVIGDLGKHQPRIEIWFDRFSGYDERRLCACFHSDERPAILAITKLVSARLWPVRVVSTADIGEGEYIVLTERLGRSEFNVPILERLADGCTFYGIYDATRQSKERVSRHFCSRAVAFFEDVAREMPDANAADEQREVYPQFENRKLVASHLKRERSRLLATECKIRDGYICQVCQLSFEDLYGPLGKGFAEAHHMVPLGDLQEQVKTSVEDLITVCANCHRILHRMNGNADDIKKLRSIVRRHTGTSN